ncbi:hypothetical protein G4G28_04720 [Massilia sp. Dwa41.01b]|uniref:hypothetical protein n=1 Tax=unclassified Massilia TaxID=2609279 RepID=UPI0016021C5F|nr:MULTISPECIES: hypothetical protein [unclassified Massilia]QNA87948.1 hypothetical protein G4G28_04720 [Massilia sp. Dwa41.01b]QNA98848.1 hypothetical protein G4G31_08445 [Massilia sp. Se16.2.3]
MKPSRAELHRKQKARLDTLREHRAGIASYRVPTDGTDSTGTSHAAHAILDEMLEEHAAEMAAWNAPVGVSNRETRALLAQLRTRWDSERMDALLGDCRNAVLRGIAGPFGLGQVLAAADKAGGNVTTVHNAKEGVYARSEDEFKREEYAGQAYKTARGTYRDASIHPDSQMIVDEYSGELLDYSQADCDHIYSVNQYHNEGGFMQDKGKKEAFGADPDNFAMTANGANRSKQQKALDQWRDSQATDGSGRNNKERYGLDDRRVKPAIGRGQRAASQHAPGLGDKAAYYGERAVATGTGQAGKMGLQQAVGLLLTEFLTASFDEVLDAYRKGLRGDTGSAGFFDALRKRLGRIVKRVAAKWQDTLAAFKDGAISGFLSNLATMLINMLVTTGKRVVRVIREGMMAILSALKLALFPPKGMTRAQAGDAALKLLATGLTTSLGIMAEEVAEKAITALFATHLPPLAPLAGPVAAVLVATMTGLSSALLVYAIERLDLFGVRRQREHGAVLAELDLAIADGDRRIDAMVDSVLDDEHLRLLGAV